MFESTCTDCAAGQYNENTASNAISACVSCAAGRYSTTVAATSASVCAICGAGTYSSASSPTSCTNCGIGKYLFDNSNDEILHNSVDDCLLCNAGSYQHSVGSSECISCPDGTPFGTAMGATSQAEAGCIPCFCAVGKFCPDLAAGEWRAKREKIATFTTH